MWNDGLGICNCVGSSNWLPGTWHSTSASCIIFQTEYWTFWESMSQILIITLQECLTHLQSNVVDKSRFKNAKHTLDTVDKFQQLRGRENFLFWHFQLVMWLNVSLVECFTCCKMLVIALRLRKELIFSYR